MTWDAPGQSDPNGENQIKRVIFGEPSGVGANASGSWGALITVENTSGLALEECVVRNGNVEDIDECDAASCDSLRPVEKNRPVRIGRQTVERMVSPPPPPYLAYTLPTYLSYNTGR